MSRPWVVIVSPARAEANNGNWRTAERWRAMLADAFQVRIVHDWPDGPSADDDRVMLALHARRSAPAIARWSARHPGRGLGVVLTGTDLYQDLAVSGLARASVAVAQRLVVLQELGGQALQEADRARTRVIFQSCPPIASGARPPAHLQAVVVGHLRAVKAPELVFAAARLLQARGDIRIDHLGAADGEPALETAGRETMQACPAYQWLGGRPHAETLARIASAHVLVHPSHLEGGAHVVLEAVRADTPVLASRVPGNVGMLGADYAGYFEPDDAAGLVAHLLACRDTQAVDDPATGRLARLRAQCRHRAPLFAPEAERAALHSLVHELLPP